MQTRQVLGVVAVAAGLSVPLAAQQAPASEATALVRVAEANLSQGAQPEAAARNSNAPAVPVPSTINSPELANPRLRPVRAELVSRLDSRNAKTGDPVVVRTTEKATTSNGIEIPSGSRIVGRVTDVESMTGSADHARVSIQFDRAELRSGKKLPIQSVIQSIAPGGSSAVAAAPQTTSRGSGMQLAGTVIARNGNVAIRTTAVPGVLLAANLDGQPFANASGSILGSRSDVHLDGGTTLVLAIAPENSTANSR